MRNWEQGKRKQDPAAKAYLSTTVANLEIHIFDKIFVDIFNNKFDIFLYCILSKKNIFSKI